MDIAIQNQVTYILKTTDEEDKQALRSFVKMPLLSRVKVFEEQKKVFHSIKARITEDVSLSVLSYSSLVIAINKYNNSIDVVDKNILEIRSKTVRKFAKKEKLLAKWALIKELKNSQGLSFREIVKYLKKYHKLEVVHSTVYDLWKELECNEKGKK